MTLHTTDSGDQVLLVAQQLRNTRSGVGAYARVLLREMTARGIPPALATWTPEIDRDDFPTTRFVDLGERPRWDPTPGGFVAIGRRVARALETENLRPSLVHFTDAREAHGYLRNTTAASRGTVVGTVHDDYAARAPANPFHYVGRAADPFVRWAYYRWVASVERRLYPRLTRLVVNSHATAAAVARRYGLDRGRLHVVPLCIGEDAVGQGGEVELRGDPAILFAGGNFYRKGLDTLVRAVARVRERAPKVHLHVAGHDRAEGRIRRLAHRSDVDSATTFHGRVPRDRMAAMTAAADVFAMPSRTEALGLVYLEAMRAGTPVVSGDVGGVTEIVRDGDSGLTVPPEDPSALAAAILRLREERGLAERLVEGGHRVVAGRTPARLVDEILTVHRQATRSVGQ